MKHIVSVSLGSSKRDHAFETDFMGERFRIERIGTAACFVRIGKPVAVAKLRQLHAGGHDADRGDHAALAQQLRDTLARREYPVGEIRILRDKLDREPLQQRRVAGNVMRVLLVQRVVRKHQRQLSITGDAQRRHAEQERVVRVHDMGPEFIERVAEQSRYRERHGEIAAIEVLHRGDAQDILAAQKEAERLAQMVNLARQRGLLSSFGDAP